MNETEELEELDLFTWTEEDLAKPKEQSPQFGYMKSIGNNFKKIKEKDKKFNEAINNLDTTLQNNIIHIYQVKVTTEIKELTEYELPCSYIVRQWRYRNILQ